MIHRGDIVTYRDEHDKPLMVISAPYDYGGQRVVTAKRMGGGKSKSTQTHGIYAVEALKKKKDDQ